MCREDVFLSDPLLPCGQRVPLYLSEAPQQVSVIPARAWGHSPRRAWEETLLHSFSSGHGLSEAAAPTSCHDSLGPSHPLPGLLHRLAQWA